MVERFVEAVEQTLPADARVIKTLGDEVMVVAADPVALTDWAVRLAPPGCAASAPQPRDRHPLRRRRSTATATTSAARSTCAARVVARAQGGEVLVTRPVVDAADGRRRPAASSRSARSA